MEQEYIAFISYRHIPVDMAAAKKIHRLIERYIIPKKLRKNGNKKLGIVFRDEDELNISASLSDGLCNALDKSKYLIVICTPEYNESKWCRQEISYFLKSHDISQVLPILVSGTPYESFPEELFQKKIIDGKEMISEPLAANVAADTIDEIEKKISHEYLRIVARMLECNYDDLVQRQKRYERRRLMIVLSIVFAVLFSFIGMLLVKNRQVNEQYLESRRNQAKNLARLSLDEYNKGYRSAAISAALEVMPEGNASGPVVPEQSYALSTALNTYSLSYVPVNSVDTLKNGDHYYVSKDINYYYVYSDNNVQLYSMKDNELLYSYETSDLTIQSVVHKDDHSFLLVSDGSILYVDTKDEKSIKTIYEDTANINHVDCSDNIIAFTDYSAKLIIINSETGDIIYNKDFNENAEVSGVTYSIKTISLNESGTSLAIGFDYEYKPIADNNYLHLDLELNKKEEEYFEKNTPYGTVALDIVSGEIAILSSNRTENVKYENDSVAAEHYSYPIVVIKTYPAALDPVRHHFASLYSVADGECYFTGDTITSETSNSFGSNHGIISYNSKNTNVILIWIGNTGAVIDEATHEILYFDGFHSDIIYMGTFEDYNVDFVLSNGSIQQMHLANDVNMRNNRLKLDATVYDAWGKDGTYYLKPEGTDSLICCEETIWDDYKKVSTTNDQLKSYVVKDIIYEESYTDNFRVVKYQNPEREYQNDSLCSGFEIYKTLSEDVLFSYNAQDPEGLIYDIAVSNDGSLVTIVEQTSSFLTIISQYSLIDGTQIFQKTNEDIGEFKYRKEIAFSTDKKSFVCIVNSDGLNDIFYIYDISEADGEPVTFPLESINADELVVTADDKYIVFSSKTEDYDGEQLNIYDLETKETSVMPIPVTFDMLFGKLVQVKDSIIMVCSKDSEILVADAEKKTFLDSFDIRSNSVISYLSASDELLVAHNQTIDLIDFESHNILDQIELDEKPWHIVTDSNSELIEAKIDNSYRSTNDNGWNLSSSYIINIDKDRKMHVQDHIIPYNGDVCFSPSGKEIALILPKNEGNFRYDHLLSFEEMVQKAKELER